MNSIFDIRQYMPAQNSPTKITDVIQQAIDAAHQTGGGIVFIPAGRYSCGTLHLKSNITLEFAPGAELEMHSDEDEFDPGEELDYDSHADFETTYFRFSLIQIIDCENVRIQGPGILSNTYYKRGGPKPIAVKNSSRVTIRDIQIINAPNYALSIMNSEFIIIDSVHIEGAQADGIDLDNTRNARVNNCFIDAWDDGICLKTSPALGYVSSTKYITVTNCIIASSCNAFKMGTESSGDCNHVTFSNSVIIPRKSARKAMAGIALESVDGSHIRAFEISNIVIDGAYCPIFLRLGNRGRAQSEPTPGCIEDIQIANITVTDAGFPCIIAGIPDFPIRHVSLNHLRIRYSAEMSNPRIPSKDEIVPQRPPLRDKDTDPFQVPELEDHYPEADMFGPLPTWGFYARHVYGLSLNQCEIHQTESAVDSRKTNIGMYLEKVNCSVIQQLQIIPKCISNSKNEQVALIWGKNLQNACIQLIARSKWDHSSVHLAGKETKSVNIELIQADQNNHQNVVLDPEIMKTNINVRMILF
jgi:hypothetical protein